MLRNTHNRYGLISRLLHWVIAAGLIGMLVFGTYLGSMKVTLENLYLFGWHKSIGILLLALIVVRVLWRWISPSPDLISEGIAGWQMWLARQVHRALYILMVAVPISGLTASMASSIDTDFFGLFQVPRLVPVSPPLEMMLFEAHEVLTFALMAVVALHIAAALKRHFINKDSTLRRMLSGSE